MAGKDYYKVLGIERNASASEIKKKYRKLALKYHPDKANGDKSFEARFKEINEAYAVLSDVEKRRQYDNFGAEGFGRRFSREDIFRNFSNNSIFRDFGFGSRFNDLFSEQRTEHGGPFQSFRTQSPPGFGRDIKTEIHISLEEAYCGARKLINVHGKSMQVSIPSGVLNEQILRIAGKGKRGHDGPAGNLIIKIRIEKHTRFDLEGKDLYIKNELCLSDALLGTKLNIQTLDNKNITLTIPPGIQPGSKLRLKGKGMPSRNEEKPSGDLFVMLLVRLPTQLSSEQKAFFEGVRQQGDF